jgi:Protein of unknown function (DUF2931)
MTKKLIFQAAYALCLLAFTACQHPMEPYQTERFELSAAPAAAEGYPMEVVEGRFLNSDGTSFPVAPEFLEGDWGLSAISWGSGDPTQPAPDSLEVRWFSYPEDKFYEGHFLLPQRRIHALLKEGYWNTDRNQHETYDELTLTLLPKGVVVVWLSGQNQVLVGRYEGREIAFDFRRFNEAANRGRMIAQEQAKLPAAVQQEIRTGTLSTRQWDAYLKTYLWKIAFSQPLTLFDYGIGYFNAEKTQYFPTKDRTLYVSGLTEPVAKPVPTNMMLKVKTKAGNRRKIRVNSLEESETLAAFQTLHAAHPTAPITLYIETNAQASTARLSLRCEGQQLELAKAKVDLYKAE